MDRKRAGHWTASHGIRRSFQDEIKDAVEVGAQWRQRGKQCDIVLDGLPGWLPPMWGSDDRWLYLRRPEGVWKARIPPDPGSGQSYALHEATKTNGRRALRGGMSMGRLVVGVPGWIKGAGVAHPMDAAERDESLSPSAFGADVDADALGWWVIPLASEPGGVLLGAGDHFDKPPSFKMQGEWLIATDRSSGRRVAYPIEADALALIRTGQLWLQFGGRWLAPFRVNVCANSLSENATRTPSA